MDVDIALGGDAADDDDDDEKNISDDDDGANSEIDYDEVEVTIRSSTDIKKQTTTQETVTTKTKVEQVGEDGVAPDVLRDAKPEEVGEDVIERCVGGAEEKKVILRIAKNPHLSSKELSKTTYTTCVPSNPGASGSLEYRTSLWVDLVGSQVKVLSFLTYLFRGFGKDFEKYKGNIEMKVKNGQVVQKRERATTPGIPSAVVRLLRSVTCLPAAASITQTTSPPLGSPASHNANDATDWVTTTVTTETEQACGSRVTQEMKEVKVVEEKTDTTVTETPAKQNIGKDGDEAAENATAEESKEAASKRTEEKITKTVSTTKITTTTTTGVVTSNNIELPASNSNEGPPSWQLKTSVEKTYSLHPVFFPPSTRRELLTATRHILATDFREGFFEYVDVLLDEGVVYSEEHRSLTVSGGGTSSTGDNTAINSMNSKVLMGLLGGNIEIPLKSPMHYVVRRNAHKTLGQDYDWNSTTNRSKKLIEAARKSLSDATPVEDTSTSSSEPNTTVKQDGTTVTISSTTTTSTTTKSSGPKTGPKPKSRSEKDEFCGTLITLTSETKRLPSTATAIAATTTAHGLDSTGSSTSGSKSSPASLTATDPSLSPLSYSVLATLVHDFRSRLSLKQLSRVINVFGGVVVRGSAAFPHHVPTPIQKPEHQLPTDYLFSLHGLSTGHVGSGNAGLPISIQTTSIRLLLNLVDHIYHDDSSGNPAQGRALLTRILDIIVSKFEALVKFIREVNGEDIERTIGGGGYSCICGGKGVVEVSKDGDKDVDMNDGEEDGDSTDGSSDESDDELDFYAQTTSYSTSSSSSSTSSALSTSAGSWRPEAGTPDWEWITLGIPNRQANFGKGKKKKRRLASKTGKVSTSNGYADEAVGIADGYYTPGGGSFVWNGNDPNVRPCPRCSKTSHGHKPSFSSFHPTDSIKDVKSLIRTMLMGLKTVIWCLNNYRREKQSSTSSGKAKASASGGKNTSVDEAKSSKSSKTAKGTGAKAGAKRSRASSSGDLDDVGNDDISDSERINETDPDKNPTSYKLTKYEISLISRFTVAGLACIMSVYTPKNNRHPPPPPPSSHPQTPANAQAASTFLSIGELFAVAFSVLDSDSLREVMTMSVRAPRFLLADYEYWKERQHRSNRSHSVDGNVGFNNVNSETVTTTIPPLLFDACLIHPPSIIFIQTLLANPSASITFGRVILMELCQTVPCNGRMKGLEALSYTENGDRANSFSFVTFKGNDSCGNGEAMTTKSPTNCLQPPTNRHTPHFPLTNANQTLNTYRHSVPSTTLRFFKVVFSSVGVFPENEAILRPHLKPLVKGILGCAGARHENICVSAVGGNFANGLSTGKPNHYYQLIRALFRSISGGKFESSYKELVPLLPGVLNGLYRLYNDEGERASSTSSSMSSASEYEEWVSFESSQSSNETFSNFNAHDLSGGSKPPPTPTQNKLIELTLTIPARLSTLLPHLPLLLKMVTAALRSTDGDLVNLGLRTLEFWVDNLNPEYLYPVLAGGGGGGIQAPTSSAVSINSDAGEDAKAIANSEGNEKKANTNANAPPPPQSSLLDPFASPSISLSSILNNQYPNSSPGTHHNSTLPELMSALMRHLRPAPYPYGMLGLRVLGKMGGRNRRFLRGGRGGGGSGGNVASKSSGGICSATARLEWGPKEGKDKTTTTTNSAYELPLPAPVSSALSLLARLVQASEVNKSLKIFAVNGVFRAALLSQVGPRPPILDVDQRLEECYRPHSNTASSEERQNGTKSDEAKGKDDGLTLGDVMENVENIWSSDDVFSLLKPENLNLTAYSIKVMERVTLECYMGAVDVVSGCLSSIRNGDLKIDPKSDGDRKRRNINLCLSRCLVGLVYTMGLTNACCSENEEVKGIILEAIDSLNDVVIERIDKKGRRIETAGEEVYETVAFEVVSGGGGKSKMISPFTQNDAIVSVLVSSIGSDDSSEGRSSGVKSAALSIIRFLTETVCRGKKKTKANKAKYPPSIILEDLLLKLLEGIHSTKSTTGDGFKSLMDAVFIVLPCFKLRHSDENPPSTTVDDAPTIPAGLLFTSVVYVLKCYQSLGSGNRGSVTVPVGLQFLGGCLLTLFGRIGTPKEEAYLYCDFDDVEDGEAAVTGTDMDTYADDDITLPGEITGMFLNELTSASYTARFGARMFLDTTRISSASSTALKSILYDRGVASLKVTEQIGLLEAVSYLISRNNGDDAVTTLAKGTEFAAFLDSVIGINTEFDEVIRAEDKSVGFGGMVGISPSSTSSQSSQSPSSPTMSSSPATSSSESTKSKNGPILPPSLTNDLGFGSGGAHSVGTGAIFASTGRKYQNKSSRNARVHYQGPNGEADGKSVRESSDEDSLSWSIRIPDVIAGGGGGGGSGCAGFNGSGPMTILRLKTLKMFRQLYAQEKDLFFPASANKVASGQGKTISEGLFKLLHSTFVDAYYYNCDLAGGDLGIECTNLLRDILNIGGVTTGGGGGGAKKKKVAKTSSSTSSSSSQYSSTPLGMAIEHLLVPLAESAADLGNLSIPFLAGIRRVVEVLTRQGMNNGETGNGNSEWAAPEEDLRALEKIISKIVTLGMGHLRTFAYDSSEEIIGSKLIVPGYEPYVAGEILHLLSVIDPKYFSEGKYGSVGKGKVLARVVRTVHKLEVSLQTDYPCYAGPMGSTTGLPYLGRLSKFLCGWDEKAVVEVFLGTEDGDEEKKFSRVAGNYGSMFVKLLALNDGGALEKVRTVLRSTQWGEQKLLSSCFGGAIAEPSLSKSSTLEHLQSSLVVQSRVYRGLEIIRVLNDLSGGGYFAGANMEIGRMLRDLWLKMIRDGEGVVSEEDVFERVSEFGPDGEVFSVSSSDGIFGGEEGLQTEKGARAMDKVKIDPPDPFLIFNSFTTMHSRTTQLLGELLISYGSNNLSDVSLLFDLLFVCITPPGLINSTSTGGGVDSSDVGRYLRCRTTGSCGEGRIGMSVASKRELLGLFFDMVGEDGSEGNSDESYTVLCAQRLVMPVLASTLEAEKASSSGEGGAEEKLVDADVVGMFMKKGLLHANKFGKNLNIELLKLSTLLIEYMGLPLVDHRKELIKFAWNHLKSTDATSKHWAYVNVCRFISVYETPSKIILQVYVALLRTYHAEGKELSRTALDILLPSLPTRLQPREFLKAVKWTKKIMYEEGHAQGQLLHIWGIFTRHPMIFYGYRGQFVPHMVNSLNRFGLPPNCPLENRFLSVGLAELIINWEEHKERKAKERRVAVVRLKRMKGNSGEGIVTRDEGEDERGNSEDVDFSLTKPMIEIVLNFLVRLALFTATDSWARLSSKASKLFKRGLMLWGGDCIRCVFFSKVFDQCNAQKAFEVRNKGSNVIWKGDRDDEKTFVPYKLLITTLDLLTSLLTCKSNFFIDNADKIKHVLYPCLVGGVRGGENGRQVRRKLRVFVVQVCRRYINSPPLKLLNSGFFGTLKELMELVIFDANKDASAGAAGGKRDAKTKDMTEGDQDEENVDLFEIGRSGGRCSAYFVINIIEEVCVFAPRFVENFTIPLVKISQRLARDHVQAATLATRTMTALVSQMDGCGLQKVLATPTLAIFEEAISGGCKEVVSPGSAVRSLCVCVRLLGESQMINDFTDLRKPFFQILSVLIDKADSIPLLLTCLGLVGGWLLKEGSAPLTKKERQSFLWKINSFDRLPEVPATALVSLSQMLLLRLHEKGGGVWPVCSYGRPEVAMLLSADVNIRKRYYDIFAQLKSGGRTCLDILNQIFYNDWESLGGRFWICACVDLMLGSSRLGGEGAAGRKKILNAVRTLSHVDTSLSEQLFIELVGFMWGSLPTENCKTLLTPGVELLLARPYHRQALQVARSPSENNLLCGRRSSDSRINVVQTLLRGFLSAPGGINLSPKLLNSLTCNYNCWFDVLAHFKDREEKDGDDDDDDDNDNVNDNDGNAMDVDAEGEAEGKKLSVNWVPEIQNLLSNLGETDAVFAMQRKATKNLVLKRALSLQQYGKIEAAQKLYHGMIKTNDEIGLAAGASNPAVLETENAFAAGSTLTGTEAAVGVSATAPASAGSTQNERKLNIDEEGDFPIWEQRWIETNKQLGQWSLLGPYAKVAGNNVLQVECGWKTQDWKSVKALCSSPSVIAGFEGGSTEHKIHEIYLAIADGKLTEVEKLCAQGVQLALHNWQIYPNLSAGGATQGEFLQLFHKLVELRESGQIMFEVSTHTRNRTQPDLKNILATWRERLPNAWDGLDVWDDLMTWRNHMFAAITNNFNYTDSNALAALHDKPWGACRISKVARKQGVREVALSSLGRLYATTTMDVQDAYSKLREQIVLCLDSDSQSESMGGFNIINNTNLSFFSTRQKAELFRLKGMFLEKFGGESNSLRASAMYCQSAQISPKYWKTWLSWGEHLKKLSISGAVVVKGEKEKDKKSREASAGEFRAQAMACFLEAVRCSCEGNSLLKLSDVLLMLRHGGAGTERMLMVIEMKAVSLPEWVWLSLLPSLISGLTMSCKMGCMRILEGIVVKYPQALYYSLRAFWRDRSSESGTKSGKGKEDAGDGSVALCEKLMGLMRRHHYALYYSLEFYAGEISNKLRPHVEEEIYVILKGILSMAKGSKGDEKEAIKRLKEKIKLVEEKFKPDLSELGVEFKFDGNGLKDVVRCLSSVVEKLGKTIRRIPRKLRMQRLAPKLAVVVNEPPDIWSGSCDGVLSGGLSGKVEVGVPGGSAAAVAAASAAAAVANAAVLDGGCWGKCAVDVPGEFGGNFRPSPELHGKIIGFESVVSVVHRGGGIYRRLGIRASDGRTHWFLVAVDSYSTMARDDRLCRLFNTLNTFVFSCDHNCNRRNASINATKTVALTNSVRLIGDHPMNLSFGDREGLGGGDVGNEDDWMVEYCKSRVSSFEDLYAIQKGFAGSLAFNSLMQYLFSACKSADDLVFNIGNGSVSSTGLVVEFNDAGQLASRSSPFFFSSSVQKMLGEQNINGRFAMCFSSFATVLYNRSQSLLPVLELLLRDEMAAKYKEGRGGKKGLKDNDGELEEKVVMCANKIIVRTGRCSIVDCSTADGSLPSGGGRRKLKKGEVDCAVFELINLAKGGNGNGNGNGGGKNGGKSWI